jgi:DNA-binding beta-propeller fold protein YncE
MKNYLLVLFALILPLSCFSQLLGPESIVYYPKGDYFLVSNAGNGTISIFEQPDIVKVFLNGFSGLSSPKGMCVVGDTLFVADVYKLVIVDIPTKTILSTKTLSADFLNDICYDGMTFLYLTDTQRNLIFRYNIKTEEISVLALKGSPLKSPNGIIYSNGFLLGVSFMPKSPIWQVDLSNNNVANINPVNLDYLDGIQKGKDGSIYITSWGSNPQSNEGIIYKFKDEFNETKEYFAVNLSGPADLLYKDDVLYVPEMNANKITIFNFNSIKEEKKIEGSMNGNLQFPAEILPPYLIEVYNLQGNLVISETTYNSTYKIDLPTGTYFVRINGKSYGKILISR